MAIRGLLYTEMPFYQDKTSVFAPLRRHNYGELTDRISSINIFQYDPELTKTLLFKGSVKE